MRRGFLRSLAAFLSGTAFAVTIAGPVQFDPCPEHGVGALSVAASMAMPAGDDMVMLPAPAEGAHGHHGAGHVCTCPGGLCGSSPVGLSVAAPTALVASVTLGGGASVFPAATIPAAASLQLRLALANAPPAVRAESQGAAHLST